MLTCFHIGNSYAVNYCTQSHSVDLMATLAAKLGQRIKDLREERGSSQREFALMVGMNKTYIGDIELGKRNPSLKSLERIAGGFGLSVGKLIGDIESD